MMHDILCPNTPCSCIPDNFGHMPTCGYACYCELIAIVREDQNKRLVAGYRCVYCLSPIPTEHIVIHIQQHIFDEIDKMSRPETD
jgi:hypothetical protein